MIISKWGNYIKVGQKLFQNGAKFYFKVGQLFQSGATISKWDIKTEALAKSMNMFIWAIGILNQQFIRDSYTQIKFSKKNLSSQW